MQFVAFDDLAFNSMTLLNELRVCSSSIPSSNNNAHLAMHFRQWINPVRETKATRGSLNFSQVRNLLFRIEEIPIESSIAVYFEAMYAIPNEYSGGIEYPAKDKRKSRLGSSNSDQPKSERHWVKKVRKSDG
jgi:hypothetical protein